MSETIFEMSQKGYPFNSLEAALRAMQFCLPLTFEETQKVAKETKDLLFFNLTDLGFSGGKPWNFYEESLFVDDHFYAVPSAIIIVRCIERQKKWFRDNDVQEKINGYVLRGLHHALKDIGKVVNHQLTPITNFPGFNLGVSISNQLDTTGCATSYTIKQLPSQPEENKTP